MATFLGKHTHPQNQAGLTGCQPLGCEAKITEIFNNEVSYGYCAVKEKMFLGFSGAFVNFNDRHPGFTESDTRKC